MGADQKASLSMQINHANEVRIHLNNWSTGKNAIRVRLCPPTQETADYTFIVARLHKHPDNTVTLDPSGFEAVERRFRKIMGDMDNNETHFAFHGKSVIIRRPLAMKYWAKDGSELTPAKCDASTIFWSCPHPR